MGVARELEGQTFHRLTVVAKAGIKHQRALWECKCICGNKAWATSSQLTCGQKKSCGCLNKENYKYRTSGHGHSGKNRTPTYKSWSDMRTRCNNPKAVCYSSYGGRGIAHCERWEKFENFLADMGVKPENKTLDRIDVNGNYEPSNCRWATVEEQAANRQATVHIEYNGIKYSLSSFARHVNLSQSGVRLRLDKGWTPERIAKTNRWETVLSPERDSQ